MKTLSTEARKVLSSGVVITGNELRIVAGQLERKLYVEVNAALEAIGGAWKRGLKAHLFSENPEDALDQILVDGGFHDTKRDLNQFFTPPVLAREVVRRADVRGWAVLEPSAGEGALACEIVRQSAGSLTCLELDQKAADRLSVNLDAVSPPIHYRYVFGGPAGDFLKPLRDFKTFDRVVMNPPFARQQDIVHVTQAFGMLKPKGLLVAIMSAGVKWRDNKKAVDFRALVDRSGTIEDLPAGSFKESGTNVSTVLVTMRRA